MSSLSSTPLVVPLEGVVGADSLIGLPWPVINENTVVNVNVHCKCVTLSPHLLHILNKVCSLVRQDIHSVTRSQDIP